MNSIQKKLKSLNYENIDISTDDFYFMILKIEEEKIRLYKPKEREKLNCEKEKNYIEHIIKYLKKLNINTNNITKQNFNDIDVRNYILNNLTTLALLDDFKDLIDFDEENDDDDHEEEEKEKENENENENEKILRNKTKANEKYEETNVETKDAIMLKRLEQSKQIKNTILDSFFELNYFKNIEKEELINQEKNINLLYEIINKIFGKCNIPLLKNKHGENNEKRSDVQYELNTQNQIIKENGYNEEKKIHLITSALLLIKEKLRDQKKVENINYQEFFGLNIHVKNIKLADFVYIIKYIFTDLLKKRKKCIKMVLNELQMLTYNPIIDIKKGKVGK